MDKANLSSNRSRTSSVYKNFNSRSHSYKNQMLILSMVTPWCSLVLCKYSLSLRQAKQRRPTLIGIPIKAACQLMTFKSLPQRKILLVQKRNVSYLTSWTRLRSKCIKNCFFSSLELRVCALLSNIIRTKKVNLKYKKISQSKTCYAKRSITFSWWLRFWTLSCLRVMRLIVRCKNLPN